MSETKKRGWIKNVIIIFLVIMLVLTLFSNTIMNRSLPEVSVSNSQSGTITSQIKLSGSVSANQTKQITLEEARTVDTVLVRRGDTVARGDVLATLVKGESADIYAMEMELRQLEIAYKKMMVSEADSLVTHRRTIEDSQRELLVLQEYMVKYPELEAVVKGYEDQIAVAENTLKTIEQQIEDLDALIETVDESIADLQKQQANYSNGGASSLKEFNEMVEEREDDLDRYADATKSARQNMNAALTQRNKAQDAVDAYNNAAESKANLNAAITSLGNQIDAAKQDKSDLVTQKNGVQQEIAALDPAASDYAEKKAELEAKKDALTQQITDISEEITSLGKEKTAKENELQTVTESLAGMKDLADLEEALVSAQSLYTSAYNTYKSAEDAEEDAEDELDKLSDSGFEYFLLQSRIDEYEEQKADLNKEKKTATKESEDYAEMIVEVTELLTEAEKEIEKTLEECEEEQRTLSRKIEDAESAIALAEENGAIEDETFAMELAMKKSEIDRKKKEIADLKAEVSETEITAPVGGTIASVGITSGDDVEAETVAFEITMTDMGYTMECSVTNSQAARLRVGQEAEVQYYYWGAKPSVRITQIVSDPNSGGKNKLVTFTVEGDVSDGTSLSLVIGSQGSSYDTVVPNSAIREDANGQFVLKVVSKSSPLGNRYYAERLDVEVLASDATKSAIDASLSWGDYVITGASVPISEGMQVRMAE